MTIKQSYGNSYWEWLGLTSRVLYHYNIIRFCLNSFELFFDSQTLASPLARVSSRWLSSQAETAAAAGGFNFSKYTLSHPENNHDITEHAQEYTLQEASFMCQSRCSFLNVWENTQVACAMKSVFLRNTRWCHGRSRDETKYSRLSLLDLLFLFRHGFCCLFCPNHFLTKVQPGNKVCIF